MPPPPTLHPPPSTLHSLACAVTLALFVTTWAARPAAASCTCERSELELVFVIDATSSMKHMIGTVKAQAEKIIHVLASYLGSVRVGLVAFRTATAGDRKFMDRASLPLTADRAQVIAKIRALKAEGGGIEACEEGLARAVFEMNWTRGRRKVVILIGDEGPDPEKEREMHAISRRAAERGIIINTITVSETACRYYGNLNPQWKARMARLQGIDYCRNFRLPIFVETAQIAGGRAAGSHNVRDLVKSVLSFGLSDRPGDEADEATVKDLIAWQGPSSPAEPQDGNKSPPQPSGLGPQAYLFARLRHAGEWNVPHGEAALMTHLARRLSVSAPLRLRPLDVADPELFRYGLAYLSGHGPMNFSPEQKTRLKTYLERGGTILADPCCGRRAFDRAFRQLMGELFGAGALRPLAADHEIFDVAYSLDSVRYCERHRSAHYRERPPRLEGLTVAGRLAVIYSPVDLGCGWGRQRFGLPCQLHDDDALKITVNAILYAFSQ